MARPKGRRSLASIPVRATALEPLASLLDKLPEKPKEKLSLREAIDRLREPLNASIAKGYTPEDLAGMLGEQGLEISVSTLKRYLSVSRKESGTKSKGRQSRKVASASSASTDALPASTQPSTSTPPSGTKSKKKAAPVNASSTTQPLAIAKNEVTELAPAETSGKTTNRSKTTATKRTNQAKAQPASKASSKVKPDTKTDTKADTKTTKAPPSSRTEPKSKSPRTTTPAKPARGRRKAT